ncbi:MAG: carbamoyl-phosphate synthase large subunit [Oscillospiraceae bacterium]|nr:carbamoyl-phosphate synthase large subunit [Oscillospiraceae bacterium]
MPRNPDIKKVLVIGSGPIVIGQAAEFDYAGVQACRALKEDGIEIVLVNSNPATIMTDNVMADKIYIEPLTLTTIQRIIEKEKPDSILSGLGGQTGLTLSMQLARSGFLESHNVRLLGSFPDTIDKAEDRQMFKDTMASIGQPCVPSEVVTQVEDALAFAETIGYPVIVRPAFTLGGSGGGIAQDPDQLREIAAGGIAQSPISQILVERCVAGWKEIEFEVMRDHVGNVITVCSMENFDPVGVHTGDSIVIAPCVTLADKEYQMLRSAALQIIDTLGVEGGCNCQFALNPDSFEYAVIEVNPRVSRSSALASKATGYPIAKVAAKIALGYTLDEIQNAVTGTTFAAFEPAIDYVAVKFPKWPFDKFVYAKRTLGTQMKATGEVLAISDSFESAIMKAVRGAEISLETLRSPAVQELSDQELEEKLAEPTDLRLFYIYESLMRGVDVERLFQQTKIDRWFLNKLLNLAQYEQAITGQALTEQSYYQGKKLGFPDRALAALSGSPLPASCSPTYKMVDTCSGEFAATTPYFYASFNSAASGGENEVLPFLNRSGKQTVVVLGSGPIRIGQGIEFDYASVHCVNALKELGYEVVIINNNPETVSTDFDIGDRLYFEPLYQEDVLHILEVEKPCGVVVAFGGQTSIKLTKCLSQHGIPIIGTSADSIDMAEDRERFDELLEKLNICRPKGHTVMTTPQALAAANDLGYPVLMRPSYVLGGQNMIIAFHDDDIREYMAIILSHDIENPVLVDKYIEGKEIEVDAIFDGNDVLMPGIMEHIERTGIHSGDSIAVYPATHIDDDMAARLVETTKQLCVGLNAVGIVNIQYIIQDDNIYIIEVNPRASRTVPYLSKVTGVPMVDLALRVSLGEKLTDLGFGTGLYKTPPYIAVKVPVFSFEKLIDVDTQLGPEMKSTGEVLGVGKSLREALYKGLVAAGYKMYKEGGVLLTVRDSDKHEVAEIGRKFQRLGFQLYATEGTAAVLQAAGLHPTVVRKIHEGPDNTVTLMESGKVNYILSTSAKGRIPALDSVKMRRRACALGIPCVTSVDTANALADSLMSRFSEYSTSLVDINHKSDQLKKIDFVKMQTCGNDYIYIDCFDQHIESPESLAVSLSDRHWGIGSDGIVLICPSDKADAKVVMFNADGSDGGVSGNAMRCVGKYLYDIRGVKTRTLTVETPAGLHRMKVITKDGRVIQAEVDMGKAELHPAKIPVALEGEQVVNCPVNIAGQDYQITCVSMGNPHCVVFCQEVDGLAVGEIGPRFEHHSIFPERVNAEFVQVVNDHTLKMRAWERGSGETLACGTGACAAVVAAVLNGYCARNRAVRVILAGGSLSVRYTDDGTVFMTGGANNVYVGTVEV